MNQHNLMDTVSADSQVLAFLDKSWSSILLQSIEIFIKVATRNKHAKIQQKLLYVLEPSLKDLTVSTAKNKVKSDALTVAIISSKIMFSPYLY